MGDDGAMSPSLRTGQLASLLAAGLLVFGPGCDPTAPTGSTCASSSDCAAGEICEDNRCVARSDGGGGRDSGPGSDAFFASVVGLHVEPASAELVSVDGSRPTQAFTAMLELSDGTERAASLPVFSIDLGALGDIDEAGGVFTATGALGGTATITVEAEGRTATASVHVSLERNVYTGGLTSDAATSFAGAAVDDPSHAAGIVYPLDNVVMPQNVYPADVQWLNGSSGDVFRVRFTKSDATLTGYVPYDGLAHWLVDADGWRAVAQTNPDETAVLTVDRFEAAAGTVYSGAPVHVTFARAALTGSVYYWDIVAGRIVRIDDGTADRVNFMPTPPAGLADGSVCVGCHAVSPSGRYMAGRLGGGDNTGTVFDLTTDLTATPAPSLWPLDNTKRWWFASWSPDETRMVVSWHEADPAGGQMRFMDPFTGNFVGVSGTAPTNITHPAWSPDGTAIAYVDSPNRWGGEYASGNIGVVEVTGPDALGASSVIHTASSVGDGGYYDGYPTWTPDSQRIAFSHGLNGRSETGQASLYLMNRDGSGVIRLDQATGGAAVDSFQPRFSPFDSGGYYWLSFLSRRDYGNSAVGTRGRGYQQIWVAAIRKDSLGTGADPSAVGYWLPGQATTSRNIAAYWAPRACRSDGDSCSVGSECCGGECRPPSEGGAPVCSPPPPERCRRDGETCSTSADCCEGSDLTCYNNVCLVTPG